MRRRCGACVGSPAPGGLVLLGEGYWRRPPAAVYLDALSATADELTDYAGTIEAGAARGLTPLYVVTSSLDDFDQYEWRWSANGERYAAAHHGEPGVDQLLAWIRRGRHRYVALGGRETLGFGLFLYQLLLRGLPSVVAREVQGWRWDAGGKSERR